MTVRARHAAKRLDQVPHGALDDLRAVVLPGDGVVARMPGVALVVRESGNPATADLLSICAAVANGHRDLPGTPLVRQLVKWLSEQDDRGGELPEFGVVAASMRGIAVLLCGGVRATMSGPTEVSMCGQDSSTWLDRLVEWPTGPLTLSSGADASLGVSGTGPGGGDWWDLCAGVVRGGGLVLHPTRDAKERQVLGDRQVLSGPQALIGPQVLNGHQVLSGPPAIGDRQVLGPRPTSVPLREAGDVAGESPLTAQQPAVEPVAARAGAGEPAPLQLDETWLPERPRGQETRARDVVQGVLCAREHLNNPAAAFCVVCGIRMDQRSGPLATGRRPPLGLLVLEDGTTVLVDGDYVIGRDPEQHDGVRSGTARPLLLEDEGGTLSRVHAEIHIRDWDVSIVDCGSINGTYVAQRDSSSWTRLTTGKPENLVQGMRVQVGSRVLQYESHHGLR